MNNGFNDADMNHSFNDTKDREQSSGFDRGAYKDFEHKSLKTASQLKGLARDSLAGNLGGVIGAFLIFALIYTVVLNLITPTGESTFSLVALHVSNLVVSLLLGLFNSGFAYLFLQVTYKNEARASYVFHGFSQNQNTAIVIQLIMVTVSFLAGVPLLVYELYAAEALDLKIFLALSALSVVLDFLLALPFAQAFYLLQDFPAQSAASLLKASMRLMRGQYLRYIKLTVSFLPLLILGVITLFVPLLWIIAYYDAAKAVFYKELMSKA